MDLMNKFMDLVFAPSCLVVLFLFAPPYLLLKSLCYVFHIFACESVRDKVVVITGASSGIGEALAYEYAKTGAKLALVARREQSLNEVAEKARQFGSPDVLPIPADVSPADECKRFVDEAVNHFVDHLVCNAGILCISMFEEAADITTFSPVMDINFWGAVYPTYHAIPHLKRSRGKIVVNSSSGAFLTFPRQSLYSASKAALISFFETLRVELGSQIKITIATPGIIESEITKGKFLGKTGQMQVDEDVRDAGIGRFPLLMQRNVQKP